MALKVFDIFDEVNMLVRDASPEIAANLLNYTNEALFAIAEDGKFPELRALTSVATELGQAWVNMPSGFDGRLIYVGNADGPIPINLEGLEGLLEKYPGLDQQGDIEQVAQEASLLYYQGIPTTAQTLTILMYKNPTLLVSEDDTLPTYVPVHLQRPLFSHRTAAIIFDKIEDGMEGQKVNTAAQMNLYNGYRQKLLEYQARRRIHLAKSVWDI